MTWFCPFCNEINLQYNPVIYDYPQLIGSGKSSSLSKSEINEDIQMEITLTLHVEHANIIDDDMVIEDVTDDEKEDEYNMSEDKIYEDNSELEFEKFFVTEDESKKELEIEIDCEDYEGASIADAY
ncbi:12628_t:CDS:2 [Dentiscutata erythropus]|uniref:12628_t:CDS:1 n=1 Tax=Dentiscutata erythropus TaxID=1348616 RepID=A0A9N9N6V4_9GLOM|nr:12628_t:CDS:2 [Dentiscutata erythropus]